MTAGLLNPELLRINNIKKTRKEKKERHLTLNKPRILEIKLYHVVVANVNDI